MRLKIMKLLKHFRFMFERIEPCKLTKIINKGNIIIIVANRARSRAQTSEKINWRGVVETHVDLGNGS
jgi:hypothetical protein